jgi:hypothetical protein
MMPTDGSAMMAPSTCWMHSEAPLLRKRSLGSQATPSRARRNSATVWRMLSTPCESEYAPVLSCFESASARAMASGAKSGASAARTAGSSRFLTGARSSSASTSRKNVMGFWLSACGLPMLHATVCLKGYLAGFTSRSWRIASARCGMRPRTAYCALTRCWLIVAGVSTFPLYARVPLAAAIVPRRGRCCIFRSWRPAETAAQKLNFKKPPCAAIGPSVGSRAVFLTPDSWRWPPGIITRVRGLLVRCWSMNLSLT